MRLSVLFGISPMTNAMEASLAFYAMGTLPMTPGFARRATKHAATRYGPRHPFVRTDAEMGYHTFTERGTPSCHHDEDEQEAVAAAIQTFYGSTEPQSLRRCPRLDKNEKNYAPLPATPGNGEPP